MPDWLAAVLLGVIEGVTEFLPVSSTGHLIIAEQWLGPRSDFFTVGIQSGAVLAVALIFTERLKGLMLRWRDPEPRDYLMKLAAAFVLTAVGGLLLKKGLGFKLPETAVPVAVATVVGGVLFLVVERWLRGRQTTAEICWRSALLVGVGQLVAAAFPGASRSGTTILMALALGVSRPAATEFSFLLGIPTLMAAGALELVSALREGGITAADWGDFGLGLVASAVTAFVTVRWLLQFVQTHTFEAFGWYRIVLGLLLLLA
jgi:undecaprenyl-diphosphatase